MFRNFVMGMCMGRLSMINFEIIFIRDLMIRDVMWEEYYFY